MLFKNDGKDTLNTIPVVYEVPGITKAKNFESWTGVLLPDSIIEYSFNTQYPGPANDYQLVCYTSINNDINPYNDTLKTDLVAWHIPGDVGMEKVSVYGPYVWGTDSSMALEETFVRVEMVNYGSSAIDTLSLSYNVTDGQNGSDIWTGQLQAGDTLKYLFAKPFYSPGGSYGICAQAYAIEDTVNANDTICNNFTGVVGVESPYLPGVFVYQNVPNPATGKIKISYSIPRYGVIDFELFDKLGQLIKQRSYTKEKGTYDIMLNTDNLSPGVYIYCISFEGFKICRKMIVVH
ncbi:MAG: T9SS type A sorting domain-containing protein [Bacteroidales bacterium]